MRADSAGASHWFVEHCTDCNIEVSVGMHVDGHIREALMLVQEEHWVRAVETNGQVRDGTWSPS